MEANEVSIGINIYIYKYIWKMFSIITIVNSNSDWYLSLLPCILIILCLLYLGKELEGKRKCSLHKLDI